MARMSVLRLVSIFSFLVIVNVSVGWVAEAIRLLWTVRVVLL